MAEAILNKKSVTFCNVAMYFSEEEWMLLEKWQKELYRTVMKEIHEALISLGYSIVHPDVLVRIKEEPPYYGANPNADIQQNAKPTSHGVHVQPSVLLRIKQDEPSAKGPYLSTENGDVGRTEADGEHVQPSVLLRIKQDEPSAKGPYLSTEKGDVDRTPAVCTNFNPELSLWIKQVADPGSQMHYDSEEGESIDCPTTDILDVPSRLSCSIKEEEEMFPITCSEIELFHGPDRADKNCGTDWMDHFQEPKMKPEILFEEGTGNNPNVSEKGKLFKKKHIPSYYPGRTSEDEQQLPLDGDRPYKCAVCEKSFRFKSYFIRHKRIHTGEKPFKCNHCEKGFNQKENLTKHVMTHSDDRSYKCPECEKGFSSRAYLRIHKRIHTGEKPYRCEECGKSFSHNSYLIHHRKTHAEDKPYKCTDCVKSFTQNYDLMRHRRTHTGERPYQCLECEKSFSNKWGLMRHQKRHTTQAEPVANSS